MQFWRMHGYWPNILNPRSFSEKVFNRMLYSRNPLWTIFLDKFCVRDYVARKVGNDYLIPMLWSGEKPEEIPYDALPLRFVIKANHGCAYNIIVNHKMQLDREKTRLLLKKWLSENFCQDKNIGTEWGYKNIRPTIIVEEFLEQDGKVPVDYKFYCFSGKVEFMHMDFDRFEGLRRAVFDRDFDQLDIAIHGKKYEGKPIRPENFEVMMQVAEIIAENLDFIRVDLYNIDGKIFFGELTCYPGGGQGRFNQKEYDFLFGGKWKWE